MQSSPDNATITLDDGQTVSADLMICADGYDSKFKSIVTGVEDDEDPFTPPKSHLLLTWTLPMDAIRQDKVLQYNTDPAQVCYLISLNEMYVLSRTSFKVASLASLERTRIYLSPERSCECLAAKLSLRT